MKNLLRSLLNYLKDWKNLLTHTLTGVGILLVAFFVPVAPIYRVFILIGVIFFNVMRMKHTKKFLQARD